MGARGAPLVPDGVSTTTVTAPWSQGFHEGIGMFCGLVVGDAVPFIYDVDPGPRDPGIRGALLGPPRDFNSGGQS